MPTITVDAVGDAQPRSSNLLFADARLALSSFKRFSLTWMGAAIIRDAHSTEVS